jgi:hypothetical protein
MGKSTEKFDFEELWQEKLARAVEKAAGPETRERVMAGGEVLSQDSPAEEKIRWTCAALSRLADSRGIKERQVILAECACRYSVEDLGDVKAAFRESGDVDQAILMLQEKFEGFLRESLGLEESLISTINSHGWGLAGILDAKQKRIIATKIPKGGYIRDYFNENDPEVKRRLYCHCPRVREGVGKEPQLQEEYCYCGAGFYKSIWEEILGEPVQVEMLESVMRGDEVCKVAIYLPE